MQKKSYLSGASWHHHSGGRPLKVRVDGCSIQCNKVSQCERLLDVAQKLGEICPTTIKSDSFAITAGTVEQCIKATSVTKVLAEQAPIEAKFLGNKIKSGTLKKFILGGVIIVGLTLGYKYLATRLNKKEEDDDKKESENVKKEDEESLSDKAKREYLNNVTSPQTMSEVMNQQGEVLQWLVEGYYIVGGINVIAGPKGFGKTTYAVQFGLSIAYAEPLLAVGSRFKFCQNPHPVLFYDLELSPAVFKNRYPQIKQGDMFRWCHRSVPPTPIVFLDSIEADLDNMTGLVTIFIDNLKKLGPTLSQPNDADNFFNRLQQIQKDAKKRGCVVTFFLLGHTNSDYKTYNRINFEDFSCSQYIATFIDSYTTFGPTCFGKNYSRQVFENIRHAESYPDEAVVMKRVANPNLQYEFVAEMAEAESRPKKAGSIVKLPASAPGLKGKTSHTISSNTKLTSEQFSLLEQLLTEKLEKKRTISDDAIALQVGCCRDTVISWKKKFKSTI